MLRLTLSTLFFCFVFQSFSQEDDALKVFLDCDFCDNTYIKQNLNNVQFVRDQNFAEVHLFFVRQTNGSGGRFYDVDFIDDSEIEKFFENIFKDKNTTFKKATKKAKRQAKREKNKSWFKRVFGKKE